MADETDALRQRANAIDEQGKAEFGDNLWQGLMEGIGRKLQSERMTQGELVETLARPDAMQRLLYSGLEEASEETWRCWRNAQPRRRQRIEAANRDRGRE